MLTLEKRMDENTGVNVNLQSDLCEVQNTMENLVSECEKTMIQMRIIVNYLRNIPFYHYVSEV